MKSGTESTVHIKQNHLFHTYDKRNCVTTKNDGDETDDEDEDKGKPRQFEMRTRKWKKKQTHNLHPKPYVQCNVNLCDMLYVCV